jgi:membrane protease YdiL (CAAX protease family)
MKRVAVRYPFLFGILVILVTVLGQMWPLWVPGLSQGAQILLARASNIALAVFLLTWFKWWQEAGFVHIRSWKILLPYLPLILLVLAGYASIFAVSGLIGIKVNNPALILLGVVSFLAGGFVEEALFRGVVLRAFLPRKLLEAAFLSALVFAVAHLFNMLVGQDLSYSAMQFIYTFLIGFAFVTPLACTRNIWPLVILHGLMNFSNFLATGNITAVGTESPSFDQVLTEIILFGLIAGYGFWLLRREDRRINQNAAIQE